MKSNRKKEMILEIRFWSRPGGKRWSATNLVFSENTSKMSQINNIIIYQNSSWHMVGN